MNAEFFAAIEDIEKEKGIPRGYMYEKIQQAMLAAFRRDHPENEDNVEIILDESKKRIEMQVNKLVVEEVEDPAHEIQQDAALRGVLAEVLGHARRADRDHGATGNGALNAEAGW